MIFSLPRRESSTIWARPQQLRTFDTFFEPVAFHKATPDSSRTGMYVENGRHPVGFDTLCLCHIDTIHSPVVESMPAFHFSLERNNAIKSDRRWHACGSLGSLWRLSPEGRLRTCPCGHRPDDCLDRGIGTLR